jgi:hypothetical protein
MISWELPSIPVFRIEQSANATFVAAVQQKNEKMLKIKSDEKSLDIAWLQNNPELLIKKAY